MYISCTGRRWVVCERALRENATKEECSLLISFTTFHQQNRNLPCNIG
uniref:Uncharacterized protein n=1 Tax=Ciona savignyi TaxID=51511 RepID=H2Y6P9_CIOSA